jgi:hypothetical protein
MSRPSKRPGSDYEFGGLTYANYPYASCEGCGHSDGNQTSLTMVMTTDELLCLDCVKQCGSDGKSSG